MTGYVGRIERAPRHVQSLCQFCDSSRRLTQRSLVRAKIEVNCFLKIVDNRRRLASTAADDRPRRGRGAAPDDHAAADQLALERRPGRARADDPLGRAAPGRQAHRDGARRPPRRLARAAARGLPHARGGRPGAHREEPRRLRARHRRSRKRSRSSTCARRWTSWSAAASPSIDHAGRAEGGRAPWSTQMEQAVKAKDAQRLPPAQPPFHDRLVELAGNSKLTAIYRKLIKELSLFRRLNLADGWLLPISAGEHRADRQGDRLGRRRSGRAGDVRPRHGKQGANDQEPPTSARGTAASRRLDDEKAAR